MARHAKSTLINPLNIPIPQIIFEEMNAFRLREISSLLRIIQETSTRLNEGPCRGQPREGCTCLQRLTKAVTCSGLDPSTISLQVEPYNGIQLKKVVMRLYRHTPANTMMDDHSEFNDGLCFLRMVVRPTLSNNFECLGVTFSDVFKGEDDSDEEFESDSD